MGSVPYMLPMQGFRTRSAPGVARRSLRGLGSQAMPMALANPQPTDATDCSYWDFFFNKAAWQACVNAAGVRQIQSVVTTAQNEGYSPEVVAAAQDAASAQEAQVAQDTANIADTYGAGSLLAPPNSPTITPWWLWLGIGALAVIVVKQL